MERQAGLGRSLEDVLDSLTPVESDPAAPGRVLFEPGDLEQQLDQLMGDIAALRERVQHLVGLVPEDAVLRVVPDPEHAGRAPINFDGAPSTGTGEGKAEKAKGEKKKSRKKKGKKHRAD